MDYDFMMISGQLKKIQLEMLEEFTGVLDALMKLKQEGELLSEYWKSAAAENFFATLHEEWEKACVMSDEILEYIGKLQMLEKELEKRENKVRQEVIKGGGAEVWMAEIH